VSLAPLLAGLPASLVAGPAPACPPWAPSGPGSQVGVFQHTTPLSTTRAARSRLAPPANWLALPVLTGWSMMRRGQRGPSVVSR